MALPLAEPVEGREVATAGLALPTRLDPVQSLWQRTLAGLTEVWQEEPTHYYRSQELQTRIDRS